MTELTQPTQSKGIGKSVVIGLSVLVVILGISIVYVYSQLNSLNITYQNYVSTHSYSNTQYSSLNTSLTTLQNFHQNYATSHNHTNLEYDSLQSQIDALNIDNTNLQNQISALNNTLRAPKIIKVNLQAEDLFQGAGGYLHVYGCLCNVGSNPAYNCRLHVMAYQSVGVDEIVINTYIELGTIPGESWIIYDGYLPYGGGYFVRLTSWTITEEWTS